MKAKQGTPVRPLTPGMQRMLHIAAGLVFIVGIQLFVFSTATERFFAWTLNPPLTAAFMGAAYWSSCALEALAARQQQWARARVAVPAVLLFTTLTLIATLIHLDRFHLSLAEHAWYTVALTWVWIAVYALVPLAMLVLLVLQLRTPGSDAPPQHRLPVWLRLLLVAQALVLLLCGGLLFVAPALIIDAWPWTLSPVSGRFLGAWLLGLGVAAGHTAWENDSIRVYPSLVSMLVFALLQGIALARFPGDIGNWNSAAWVYIGFLLSVLLAGLAGVWSARSAGQAASVVQH